MAKRGPGKFESDLDAALYELALDQSVVDEDVGSSSEPPGTWAGLLRGGASLALAIKESAESGESPFRDVDADDLAFLRRDGKAGVIVMEHDSGRVEVAYYAAEKNLDRDWSQVRSDLYVPEFESNGEEDILREERFEPYLEGKGPVFDVEMWYAGRGRLKGTKRVDNDRDFTGYRLTMTEPGKKPVVVFEGEDLSLPAGTDAAGDRALEDLMGFLTLKPGDTDDEYFEKYTPAQIRFAEEHAESLSMVVEDLLHPEEREENGRRRNGNARFRVYLNGEVSDTVFFHDDMSESEVKRSLIDHDGYDPRITVKKVEPRRTGIPAEAYVENAAKAKLRYGDIVRVGPAYRMGDSPGRGRRSPDEWTGSTYTVVSLPTVGDDVGLARHSADDPEVWITARRLTKVGLRKATES